MVQEETLKEKFNILVNMNFLFLVEIYVFFFFYGGVCQTISRLPGNQRRLHES